MPPTRRIISIWLPRFAAEQRLRREPLSAAAPFAVIGETNGALTVASLTAAAEAAGVRPGMALSDARAVAPGLLTRPAAPEREAAARAALARWCERFSPFVALEADGLAMDATGCAHLFDGEAAMVALIEAELERFGLTARAAMAATRGAAWALARFAPMDGAGPGARDGDAIAPDAHATRVRTPRRRKWARPAPATTRAAGGRRVAGPEETRSALAPLPVAALRLNPDLVSRLQRLGVRRIDDLLAAPRGATARRFGTEVALRLDQALGQAPEPISPLRFSAPLAARMSFPEPIGLIGDLEAALMRLLERLSGALDARGRGARRAELTLRRADGGMETLEAGLARPTREADRIAPLFLKRMEGLDLGYGVDAMRLAITETEPLEPARHQGHMEARAEGAARLSPGGGEAFADLLSRIGARIGLERLTRLRPAESHLPEHAWIAEPAAYPSHGPREWRTSGPPRPVLFLRPERIAPPGPPPERIFPGLRAAPLTAIGPPERIAPEWWLDRPDWRSGARDYRRVEDADGRRFWIYEAQGGAAEGGWFLHGEMA